MRPDLVARQQQHATIFSVADEEEQSELLLEEVPTTPRSDLTAKNHPVMQKL